jgi:hypothetical protein
MPAMRAKFEVTKIVKHPCQCGKGASCVELSMKPVCPSKFGPNGEHEDNDFHRWSPSGEFHLNITNPALQDRFEVGQKYYLDFTLAAVA